MIPRIEEVLPAIYRIEVPLSGNPLKSINSYLVKGKGRNLIVDTGMDTDECRSALLQALKLLKVDLKNSDFFISHLHVDHIGLVFQLASDRSTVFFNRPDLEFMKRVNFWDSAAKFLSMHGFPQKELREVLKKHPASHFKLEDAEIFTILGEGDTLKVGDYLFQCLETPGHTNGSMCLYEPQKKILLSGDHILGDITPNIPLNIDSTNNPLKNYMQSLEKIFAINVDLVLPGHRGIFVNCRQRIKELMSHHRQRKEEILAILRKKADSAYHIASQTSWDLTESWENSPVVQKWFAIIEILSHLKDMEEEGSVSSYQIKDKYFYQVK